MRHDGLQPKVVEQDDVGEGDGRMLYLIQSLDVLAPRSYDLHATQPRDGEILHPNGFQLRGNVLIGPVYTDG